MKPNMWYTLVIVTKMFCHRHKVVFSLHGRSLFQELLFTAFARLNLLADITKQIIGK